MVDRAIEYARRVISGDEVGCAYVRMACQRFLCDLKDERYYIDRDVIEDLSSFIRKLKFNTTPPRQFELESWQAFLLTNIYGIKLKENGRRKYKYIYIEIPRKNGKSELISAMAMYHFLFERNSLITISANSREQAKNTNFKKVKSFSYQLDSKERYLVPYYNSLKFEGVGNEILVTSSDAKRLDGLSINVGIIDELHSAKDSSVYNVIKSSMGAVEEPLLIVITTAGFDTNSFCYSLRDYVIGVLKGEIADEYQFGIIYTLDEGDDYTNPDVWVKANPNLGVSLSKSFISSEVLKAKNSPMETSGVLVKNFNIWLKESSKGWFSEGQVAGVLKEGMDISIYRNAECYVGLDLGTNTDITCFSVCIKGNDGYYFINRYFLPSMSLNSNVNRKLYKEWSNMGYITLTEGNVTDYDVVLEELVGISRLLRVKAVLYDRYNATQFAINAQKRGIHMKPFAQNFFNFNIPTKEFERLVLTERAYIEYNMVTQFMLRNVVVKTDMNGNFRPAKVNEELKIDGVVSMIMALAGWVGVNETNTFVV